MRMHAIVLWFKTLLGGLVVLALVLGELRPALAQSGTPNGWQSYTADGVSFALPGNWRALPSDAAALAAQVRQIAGSNPALARSIQLLIDSGQLGKLGFLAAGAADGAAVSVITAPLPGAVTSLALVAEVTRQLPQLLPGLTIIKSSGGLHIGGVDAARIEFRLSLNLSGGGAVAIRVVQFYLLPAGSLHVFSTIGKDDANLPTLADQIGTTIRIGGAAAPAATPSPANTLRARVSVSGNVRRGPMLSAVVIGQVKAGETVTLLGRNAASTWYRITTAKGVTGWSSATLLSVDAATKAKVPAV